MKSPHSGLRLAKNIKSFFSSHKSKKNKEHRYSKQYSCTTDNDCGKYTSSYTRTLDTYGNTISTSDTTITYYDCINGMCDFSRY